MDTTEHEVTVTFDSTTTPRKVTFTPDSPLGISTPRGLVTFNLELKGNFEARFPSNPIQWVNESRQPMDPPSGVSIVRNDTSTSITIEAGQAPEKLSFYVIVQTQAGRFFGSDPTIVTMLPPGGGQGR
ncbi:MAG TPA: hypothetical protein VGS07_27255 [Thermoanaerobaculia bacterium]|jgi:hypothetical protein|nr:hypothetical protein [Thermoanaerobaculia bacterium]